VEYYSCLCHDNFQDPTIHDSMWLYRQYKDGHLAFEGSLLEQPAKYVELIKFMEKLNNEYEQRIHEDNKG